MRFRYTREYQPCVRDAFAHVSRGTIDVLEDTDDMHSHIIGRVEIDLIDYSRVFKEGMVSLYDVVDSHGEDWLYVYSLLFDMNSGDVLREVTEPGTFDFIALMKRFELLDVARSHEATVLYHIAHINGSAVIFNMYRGMTRLSPEKLADVGFSKIAGSELIILNTSQLNWNPGYTEGGLKLKLDPKKDYTVALERLWHKV